MSGRKTQFENEKYYHVFNRGVDKRKIFLDKKDFVRFLWSIKIFNDTEAIGSLYEKYHLNLQRGVRHPIGCWTPLVKIVSYTLLDNHFHLLVEQLNDGGISLFMKKLSGGYTNYFNKKNTRSGSLFQGKFKSVEIKSDYQLWQVSCYINGNAEIHGISQAEKWPWSSCKDYLNLRNGRLCDKKSVLKDFETIDEYRELLNEVIKYSKERKEAIKEISLD